jgi:hypothetical protein
MGKGQLAHDPARADNPSGECQALAALGQTVECFERRGDGVRALCARSIPAARKRSSLASRCCWRSLNSIAS